MIKKKKITRVMLEDENWRVSKISGNVLIYVFNDIASKSEYS
jgi:hypothetical protein